jgi:hypothetical protein
MPVRFHFNFIGYEKEGNENKLAFRLKGPRSTYHAEPQKTYLYLSGEQRTFTQRHYREAKQLYILKAKYRRNKASMKQN